MRLELTNTGSAIRRLSRLATRAGLRSRGLTRRHAVKNKLRTTNSRTSFDSFRIAAYRFVFFKSALIRVHLRLLYVWSGRRDSNSRSEFGRLTCCQLHHFREDGGTPGRTRTRSLDVRSVALFQLSYRSGKNFGLRISDFGFENQPERSRPLKSGCDDAN